MYQDDPGLEQRLSRFEAQLDRFSLAFHQWQETRNDAHPADSLDVDQRIRTLEETLGREAHALRQMHEEPLKQLQAQAASLRDLLSDLSRSLQAIATDLRVGAAPTAAGAAASWPLDRVVHLHDELRRTASGGRQTVAPQEPLHESKAAVQPDSVSRAAEATEPPASRIRLLEATITGEHEASRVDEVRAAPRRRRWYVIGALIVVAAGLLTFELVRWIETRLNSAAARVAAAEQQVVATTQLATREVAAARQGADRQIAEARDLAQRAETVGVILAAPDLVRFYLTSSGTDRSSAQLLWSRTRGLVLSGSRVPVAPPDSTYQLWLLTSTQSVSAGLFVPDADGRATLVIDEPPRVAGPVVGATVTVEPSGGRPAPSGRTVLARIP